MTKSKTDTPKKIMLRLTRLAANRAPYPQPIPNTRLRIPVEGSVVCRLDEKGDAIRTLRTINDLYMEIQRLPDDYEPQAGAEAQEFEFHTGSVVGKAGSAGRSTTYSTETVTVWFESDDDADAVRGVGRPRPGRRMGAGA